MPHRQLGQNKYELVLYRLGENSITDTDLNHQ